jgi:hypothetical protein
LVPEIPLHEYVQTFRYVPPANPEEITMRGEAPVLEPERSQSSDASVTPTETTLVPEETPIPPSTDDVRERLGLDVSSADERQDRPRFLDFNEPTGSAERETPAVPISGPSFLGLSDAPLAEVETGNEADVQQAGQGRWRIGLVAAVILVVGFLGFLEWRAQVRQSNNGPIEIVKMKMRNLARNKPAETSTPAASPSANADTAAKPEMQVDSASTTQNQNPGGNSATTNDPANAPKSPGGNAGAAPPTSSAQTTPAPENVPGAQVAANPPQNSAMKPEPAPTVQSKTAAKASAASNGSHLPLASPLTSADKAATSPQPANDRGEVVTKKAAPGADEIAKANNASDSAAEAAWLWKATAKGNPDAPVRLADMYAKGDGVPRSCEQAMVLLKTAATKENALARNRLASMYGSGTCVPRDRVEAYRWLSSALDANPNSDWARQNRDLVWRQMTPEERGSIQPPH